MKNTLIKYTDICDRIKAPIHFIVWSGSREDKINSWLNPIYYRTKDAAVFYGFNDLFNGSDCGWYIDKNIILDMLHATIPDTDDLILKHDILLILNELWDYILGYKIPRQQLAKRVG